MENAAASSGEELYAASGRISQKYKFTIPNDYSHLEMSFVKICEEFCVASSKTSHKVARNNIYYCNDHITDFVWNFTRFWNLLILQ